MSRPRCPRARPQRADAETLEPVVISGSGSERRMFETPYAVGVVDAAELRAGGLMVNLSESLVRMPGLTVNNRTNLAQDPADQLARLRCALDLGVTRPWITWTFATS